jgi:hypothetical protein
MGADDPSTGSTQMPTLSLDLHLGRLPETTHQPIAEVGACRGGGGVNENPCDRQPHGSGEHAGDHEAKHQDHHQYDHVGHGDDLT